MRLRLRLLDVILRLFVKRRLARMQEADPIRQHLAHSARIVFRMPPLSLVRAALGAPGENSLWIASRPSAIKPGSPVILYMHGGAFIAGSPQTHAKMLARLSRLSGMEIFAPAYALAPEHPFPAAAKSVEAAYEYLIARGYSADQIILGGDSAGGQLALDLLARLCARGQPPRALFAFSPLTDFRFEGASARENARRDALLPRAGMGRVRDMYLNGHSPDDPRASPLRADFDNPPPVFLQFSESELLRDDSRRMAARLRHFGGEVIEDAWPDMPNVWVIFDGLLPEARVALKRVADFLRRV